MEQVISEAKKWQSVFNERKQHKEIDDHSDGKSLQ
jgi:hypothetical protein